MKKFERIAKAVIIIAMVAVFVWFMASWIDVVAHNDLASNPTNASWNMFKMLIEAAE